MSRPTSTVWIPKDLFKSIERAAVELHLNTGELLERSDASEKVRHFFSCLDIETRGERGC